MSVKQVEFVERIWDSPLHLLSCKLQILVKEKPNNNKKEWYFTTCKKTLGIWWMMSILNISWHQSTDLQNKSMDWFLYDRNFRHEGVNALLLGCIHWDIWWQQNNWNLCIQTSKEDVFNQSSKLKCLMPEKHVKLTQTSTFSVYILSLQSVKIFVLLYYYILQALIQTTNSPCN